MNNKTHNVFNSDDFYKNHYYQKLSKSGYFERTKARGEFFNTIAKVIVRDFRPKSVLDVCCSTGMLVEALRKCGINAFGFDYSDESINQIPTEYSNFVKKHSILDSNAFDRKFDVVTCLEISESFQQADLDMIIENLCNWGDTVIFNLNNSNLSENFNQENYLMTKFLQNNFTQVLNYQADYISPDAQVFQRNRAKNNIWYQAKELNPKQEAFIQQEYKSVKRKKIKEKSQKVESPKNLLLNDSENVAIPNSITKTANDEYWKKSLRLNSEKLITMLSQKQNRILSLYKTASYINQTQGFFQVAKNILKFITGERQNTKLISDSASYNSQKFRISNSVLQPLIQQSSYLKWIQNNEPTVEIFETQKIEEKSFKYRPLISIVSPIFNVDEKKLCEMIDSVIAQTYSNWELCVIDGNSSNLRILAILENYAGKDSRIKVKFLNNNLGIAESLNRAVELAQGEFVATFNQGDILAKNALFENVKLLNKFPEADMIYSDEDKLDHQGNRYEPHFKPDWSPDLFFSMMYTANLAIYRKDLVYEIGKFRLNFEGAHFYDLVLRFIEKTNKIFHIPKVLYHSRNTEDNNDRTAQIKSVTDYFQRKNIEVEVSAGLTENLIRVKRKISVQPKVSIIIPTRDKVEVLQNCIESIKKTNTYSNYEIIIVNNNSSDPATLEYLKNISKESNISVIHYNHPFNFAAINNFAAKQAEGELLLFLNNDTKAINDEWLAAMVEHAIRPEVGAVGAKLLYSNGLVQHAGVVLGIGEVAGHSHKHFESDASGYFSRINAIQNFSAVTGACMMIRREVFESLNGFDESNLAVAYNDIDLCLRIGQKNLLVVYTPYAKLYHYESLSRGSDQTAKNSGRFQTEGQYMKDHWEEILQNDPYYSPNLTKEKENFSIIE